MMTASAAAIFAACDRLCALDAAIGDGDYGITMGIVWKAALAASEAAPADTTVSDLSQAKAMAFLNAVGASADPLCATGFQGAGSAVSDRLNLDSAAMVAWLRGMGDGSVTGREASREVRHFLRKPCFPAQVMMPSMIWRCCFSTGTFLPFKL